MVLDQTCYNDEGSQLYNYWCYYEAIDQYTIIIENCYLGALIVLALVLAFSYRKLTVLRENREYRQLFGKSFVMVFYIIFAWLGSIYYAYMDGHAASTHTHTDPTSPIVILSSVFLFFEYNTAFWLLFVMLLIPYIWVYQLLMNTQQSEVIPEQIRFKINHFFNYLWVIRIYYTWIRPWYLLWLVAEPFLLFFGSEIGCNLLKYNAYFIYAESILIFATYIFGYFVGNFMRDNRLMIVDQQDEKRIKREYFLLVSVLILRMGLNFYFKLSGEYEYEPNEVCADEANKISASIFLFLALFFMHLLPICAILYIYWPNPEDRIRDQLILNNAEIRRSFLAEEGRSGSLLITTAAKEEGESGELERNLNRNRSRDEHFLE